MCKINFFLFAPSRLGRQLTNDCASKVYGFWLPFLINGTAETGILLKINKNDCDCTNTQKDISGECCCCCCFKPLVNLNKFVFSYSIYFHLNLFYINFHFILDFICMRLAINLRLWLWLHINKVLWGMRLNVEKSFSFVWESANKWNNSKCEANFQRSSTPLIFNLFISFYYLHIFVLRVLELMMAIKCRQKWFELKQEQADIHFGSRWMKTRGNRYQNDQRFY